VSTLFTVILYEVTRGPCPSTPPSAEVVATSPKRVHEEHSEVQYCKYILSQRRSREKARRRALFPSGVGSEVACRLHAALVASLGVLLGWLQGLLQGNGAASFRQ
jgi:hypothetical protein